MATERMTIDKALKSKDRYMQYGLSVTNDPKNHPVKKAILAFDDGETVDTVFAAYFTLIHAYIDQLSPDALHAYFKGAKSLKHAATQPSLADNSGNPALSTTPGGQNAKPLEHATMQPLNPEETKQT